MGTSGKIVLKNLIYNAFSEYFGAADRTRTYDPIITNDVLYQLSYSGAEVGIAPRGRFEKCLFRFGHFVRTFCCILDDVT